MATSIVSEYVETILGVGDQFLHMHVGEDPVPGLPPASILDYTHPAGEIFDDLKTEDGSSAVFCPGRENQLCSASNNLLTTNVLGKSFLEYLAWWILTLILDHFGPFATVRIGTFDCLA